MPLAKNEEKESFAFLFPCPNPISRPQTTKVHNSLTTVNTPNTFAPWSMLCLPLHSQPCYPSIPPSHPRHQLPKPASNDGRCLQSDFKPGHHQVEQLGMGLPVAQIAEVKPAHDSVSITGEGKGAGDSRPRDIR